MIKRNNNFKTRGNNPGADDRYNAQNIKRRLASNDAEALEVFQLAGVPAAVVDYTRTTGKEHAGAPCPLCGGRDRFSIVRSKSGGGLVAYCRNCSTQTKTPLDFFLESNQLELNDACRAIVDHLDGAGVPSPTRNGVTIQQAPKPSAIKPTAPRVPSLAGGTDRPPKIERRRVPKDDAERVETIHKYRDAAGAVVCSVYRQEFYQNGERVDAIDDAGRVVPKIYKQTIETGLTRADVPPYNLDRIAGASLVFIVEGEKAADVLQAALDASPLSSGKYCATTAGSSINAKLWAQRAYYYPLQKKIVKVLVDNDAEGERAAEQIAKTIATNTGAPVSICFFKTRPDGSPAPSAYDVADYLEELGTDRDALEALDEYLTANEQTREPASDQGAAERSPEPFEEFLKYEPAGTLARIAKNEPTKTAETIAGTAPEPSAQELDEQRNAAAIEGRKERERAQEQSRLLDELALEAPPFPVDLLPDCLRGYIEAIADKFHLNKSIVSFSALDCVGSFAGYKFYFYSLELGYKQLFPPLSVVGVAPSGGFKTPLFQFLTAPIGKIEDEIKERYQEERKGVEKKKEEIKRAKFEQKRIDQKLKRARRSDDQEEVERLEARAEELDAILDAEIDLKDPAEPSIYLLDPGSPQAVKEQIAVNYLNGDRNGLLVATDEGLGLFCVADGEGKALDRFKGYSQICDGFRTNERTVTRPGLTRFAVPGELRAGFLTYIQPEPFAQFLKYKTLRAQGFPNRFIKSFLPPILEIQDFEPLNNRAEALYYAIFDFLRITTGGAFTLAPEALDEYKAFLSYSLQEKKDAIERGDADETSFFSKLNARCIQIAMILAIGQHVDRAPARPYAAELETTISAETMRRAIKITKVAAETSRACDRYLLRCIANDKKAQASKRETDLEKDVLRIIEEAGAEGATRTRLQELKNALRGSRGGKKLDFILESMRDAGKIAKQGKRYFFVSLEEFKEEVE